MPKDQVSISDPILAAMWAELQRSREGLRVPGSPRPYHLAYALRRRRELLLEAAYGSLLRRRNREQGTLSVDVRVGSHEFDNVLDGGLDGDAHERESAEWMIAPDDLDPMALRCALCVPFSSRLVPSRTWSALAKLCTVLFAATVSTYHHSPDTRSGVMSSSR